MLLLFESFLGTPLRFYFDALRPDKPMLLTVHSQVPFTPRNHGF